MALHEAAVEAARERLRPILMTSFAFILGVLPLMLASGAGAASRHSIGTGVFAGMLFATSIGIFFIPLFFQIIRGLADRGNAAHGVAGTTPAAGEIMTARRARVDDRRARSSRALGSARGVRGRARRITRRPPSRRTFSSRGVGTMRIRIARSSIRSPRRVRATA